MHTVAAASRAPEISLRTLLTLAWPIIISRASQVVVGFSDAVMVASLGDEALAAVTTGGLNTFNLLILPFGVVFIVSSYASQCVGAGDPVGARRYGLYGLFIAGAAQVAAVPFILAVPTMVGWLDYSPAVQSAMATYLEIRLLSAGAAIGIEALGNYYAGIGNTRLPMVANLLAMVLNVAANWVLIFGHLGAPAMGVAGAAWASVLGTTVAFLVLLGCYWRGVGAAGTRGHGSWRWAEVGRMLRFGLPSGFNWFFEFLAFSFFVNIVVAGLGTVTVAAFMAVFQLNATSFMPAFGAASAGAVLVGQSIGAKRFESVDRAVWLTTKVNVLWQCTIGATFFLAPALWLAPFARPDGTNAEFLAVGAKVLMLSAGWQLFDGIVSTFAEALRAAGDTGYTLWARLLIAWLVFAPGAYVTVKVYDGGPTVAMLWVIAYMGILAAALLYRYRSGAWRNLSLFEDPGPPLV